MKHLKKIVSLLLATLMVFGLTATALAVDNPPAEPEPSPTTAPMEGTLTGGSIIINDAVAELEYSIYQIMYLVNTAEEGETPNYVYKANSAWKAFLNTPDAKKYVNVNTNSANPDDVTVAWKTGITEANKTKFAKLALSYAWEHNITPTKTTTATAPAPATKGESGSAQFAELSRGCYLANATSKVICELPGGEATATVTLTADPIMQGALDGGAITINNAVSTQEYSIYQLMYVESQSADETNIVYKANSHWEAFLRSSAASSYVSVTSNGYVTWTNNDSSEAKVAEFAKAALAYAEANPDIIHDVDHATAPNSTVTFANLKLGYYLLDTTMGTLCSLDTNNTSVDIHEKNVAPGNDKQVEEESDHSYGKVNDGEIGETVNFRSKVTLPAGSENVIFHDTMQGLDLVTDSIIVSEYILDDNGAIQIIKPLTGTGENADYELILGEAQEGEPIRSFDVEFNQTYLNKPIADAKTEDGTMPDGTRTSRVLITYSATINANAVIGGDGNVNSSHLSYGQTGNLETTPSTTKTYVWSFDVLKYANGDTTEILTGAEFVLLDKTEEANPKIAKFFTPEGSTDRVFDGWVEFSTLQGENGEIDWTAEDNAIYKLTSGTDGKIYVKGLDSGTYWLREIKAPDNFNLLTSDVEVKIEPTTNETSEGLTMTLESLTIEVENRSGSEMPHTGGIGTTIFYAVGLILLVGAGVLLVTKKRMSASK